ncbi:MAG: universal stress protein [Sandaracinaceae bacterium]|nr:universal stress protein [Sandaracinaceae bacterium]
MDTRHILVTTDFSDAAAAAPEAAAILLKQLGGTATIVHVLSVADLRLEAGELQQPHPEDASLEVAVHEHLDRVREEHFAGVEGVKTAMVRGPSPADAICRLAEELDASLIVIATRGRGGLARFLVGSVTERVVRHAPCAVYVVR